jgi:membrane protein
MTEENTSKGSSGGFFGWLRGRFLPGARYRLKRYGKIFLFAGREFKRDNCVVRAAALSFVLLLALVPATFVFLIVLKILGAFETYGDKLVDLAAKRIAPQAQEFATVQKWLSETTDKLVAQASGDISGISFNLLSFGAMIVTAGLLLTAIEKSLNDIWHVKVKRSIIKRFSNIWMIITLGPVLVFFSYYFGLSLYTGVQKELASQSYLYSAFLFVLPYFFSIVLFYLVLQFTPYTAVRADAALMGAIFSGLVWEFSKVPFNAYVTNVISPTGVYGSLGVIPFFLLWVYLTWVIMLFGAEIAYSKQNFAAMSSAEPHDTHFVSLYRGYYTLRILGEAAVSFLDAQGPVKLSRVAKKLQMPLSLCRELAVKLRDNGLVNYVGRDQSRLQLSKPPERITLMDALFRISTTRLEVPPKADSPTDLKIQQVFDAINEHQEETFSSVTFADIM